MKKFIFLLVLLILFLLIGVFIGNILISRDTNQSNVDIQTDISSLQWLIPQNVNKIKITISSDGTIDNNYNNIIYYLSDKAQIQTFIDIYNSLNVQQSNNSDTSELLYEINFVGDTNSTFKIYSSQLISVFYNDIENFFNITEDSLNKITESTNIKYYLHDNSLEEPSSTDCYNAQSIVLSGLSESEISSLRTTLHNLHSSLEFYLVDRVSILKDANNIYWEPATVNEVFTQPDGTQFQSSGLWEYRNELQNILNLNINEKTKIIISDALKHLQESIDNHDLSESFEAHKIIHDLDYWCIDYPIGDFKIEPTDWSGIKCYFGLIENYNL